MDNFLDLNSCNFLDYYSAYSVVSHSVIQFSLPNNKRENSDFFVPRSNLHLTTTNDIQMASTMKKEAKAEAVAKGTFYECGWCGKEGTDAPYESISRRTVCGRTSKTGTKPFCSEKCRRISCVETNRRIVLEAIDATNMALDIIKTGMAEFIKHGKKIDPVLLQVAKLFNICKKVLTLIVSGDKPSARKLYDEKKATVTDCSEDVLAHEVWSKLYMSFINEFAEIDEMMRDECLV